MRLEKSNSLKKFLFVFFAFLSLLFIFSRPITTYAISGSTVVPSPVPSSGGGHGSGKGLCNTAAIYRIMAFKVTSPEDAASKGYFGINGKKVIFKRGGDVYYADDYLETATSATSGSTKWYYWSSTWQASTAAHTSVHIQSGAKSFKLTIDGYNSGDAKDLAKAANPHLSNLKNVENYDNWGRDDDKLADELPGVSPGDSYVIVIEELKLAVEDGKYYAFTYGNWMKANSAVRANYNPGSYNTGYLNDPTHWLRQGSTAPFQKEGYRFDNAELDRKAAYSLYGDIHGTSTDSAAGNIHVQYQGEPNTVDGEFKVAGTVIKKGTNDDGEYVESGDEGIK